MTTNNSNIEAQNPLPFDGINTTWSCSTIPPPNTTSLQSTVLWKIETQREPYIIEYLNNGYGQMSTRLGTQLGI